MGLFIRTYSPQDVFLYVNGYAIQGWNEITVKQTSPRYTQQRGCRGRVTRIKQLDTSAEILVKVDQTSKSNDVLTKLLQKDYTATVNPVHIVLKDTYGGTTFDSLTAYLTGWPELSVTESIAYREWHFSTLSTTTYSVVGGGSLREQLAQKAFDYFSG